MHVARSELIERLFQCCHSVVCSLLRKSTRFHDKKTLHKKAPHYKSKLTHSENAQKMRCHANHGLCATHWKPETRKLGVSSNAQGCQVQLNKKCQTTCKKCQIASKNPKQAETGRMLLVLTFPNE